MAPVNPISGRDSAEQTYTRNSEHAGISNNSEDDRLVNEAWRQQAIDVPISDCWEESETIDTPPVR